MWSKRATVEQHQDWLLKTPAAKAEVYRSVDDKDIILDNGLLKRSFRLQPNLACTDFSNLSSGEQLLRAIGPEAKLTINGKSYKVGGLYGQSEKAYLKSAWIDKLKANNSDFVYKSYSVTPIRPYVNWKVTNRWALNKEQVTGKMLTFVFECSQPVMKDIVVKVNYELYDGIPLVCKWLSVGNQGNKKSRSIR